MCMLISDTFSLHMIKQCVRYVLTSLTGLVCATNSASSSGVWKNASIRCTSRPERFFRFNWSLKLPSPDTYKVCLWLRSYECYAAITIRAITHRSSIGTSAKSMSIFTLGWGQAGQRVATVYLLTRSSTSVILNATPERLLAWTARHTRSARRRLFEKSWSIWQ